MEERGTERRCYPSNGSRDKDGNGVEKLTAMPGEDVGAILRCECCCGVMGSVSKV